MATEKVNYSHLTGMAGVTDGVVDFGMEVTYPFSQTVFLSEESVRLQSTYLEAPKTMRRTFVLGPMTGLLVPSLGRLPDERISLIYSVHNFFDRMGIDSYSCFLRERMGQIGITSEQATILDKLALDTSDILTVLPDASNSAGTWKEIVYATKTGTALVCLFNKDDLEMGFRTRIIESAAVHAGGSELTFVTFGTAEELFSGLREVVDEMWGRAA